MKLSDTQAAILAAAAQHPEHLAVPPERLPAGARQKVAQALLKNDLVIGVHRPAYDAIAKWAVDGDEMLLKITDDGLRAIGIDPNEGDVEAGEPDCSGIEGSVPDTAPTVAPAWDDEANRESAMITSLDGPMEALRSLLAGKPARTAREPGAPRTPREGTKQEHVLAMLRRAEGATVAQISETTGWAAHTVRGFFAGLKKKGIAVEAIERVRMVGPNKKGAKGSYTVYQVKPD